VELVLAQPDAPVRIRHDPQRIGQVVANLVGNALKFTPRGGRVSIELAPTADGAELSVADTGVGIDAAELPRIFERFYRGSHANEVRSSGSGLGLAIVKSIVDIHAGRITVDSRVGGGTTFRVFLPRDPRRPADSSARTADASSDAVDAPPPAPERAGTRVASGARGTADVANSSSSPGS
jgi:signal transduction histidine kinase